MNEKVISRVEKLFVHAESAKSIGSMAEAETFAAKARALMVEHKLAIADLDLSGEATREDDVIEEFWVRSEEWGEKHKRKKSPWKGALAYALSKAYFCRVLVTSSTNSLTVIGSEDDKDAFVRGFRTLQAVAQSLCAEDYEKHCEATGQRDRTWKLSWYDGFNRGVRERIENEMKEEEKNLEESALVVVKDQMTRVDDAVGEFYPKLKSSKSKRSRSHASAFEKGKLRGKQSHKNRLT